MTKEKAKNTRVLKTARGQIDGIIKMIEEDKYCVDISNQILAAVAILKKVNSSILTEHLSSCVLNETKQEDKEKKIKEISNIISKLSKQ